MEVQMMNQQKHSSSTNSGASFSSSFETRVVQQNYQVQASVPQQQQQFIQQNTESHQQIGTAGQQQIPVQILNQQQQHNMQSQQQQQSVQQAEGDGQIRAPVATAAANYQNAIKQQMSQLANEAAGFNVRKPDVSGPSDSFPTQWPPQDQNAAQTNMTTAYPSGLKLKSEMPIEQPIVKVVPSQPAFKISKPLNVSGDKVWPPRQNEELQQSQTVVRELIKPKKQNRDYTEFFAQNALPTSYTSYRAPPGTQHRNTADDDVTNM